MVPSSMQVTRFPGVGTGSQRVCLQAQSMHMGGAPSESAQSSTLLHGAPELPHAP
jgi:hypothetical protein